MLFIKWEKGVATKNHQIGLVVVLLLGLRMGNWLVVNGHLKLHHGKDPVAIGASAISKIPRPMIGNRHGR